MARSKRRVEEEDEPLTPRTEQLTQTAYDIESQIESPSLSTPSTPRTVRSYTAPRHTISLRSPTKRPRRSLPPGLHPSHPAFTLFTAHDEDDLGLESLYEPVPSTSHTFLPVPPPFPPLPPPPPVHTMSTAPTPVAPKLKVHKPNEFDGTPTNLRGFLREVQIYIRAKKITDDEEKILFMLSYMTKKTAADWAQHFFDTHESTSFGLWTAFLAQVRAMFEDKTTCQDAREKLEHYRQGAQRINEHVTAVVMVSGL
jgi:Ty3 transposon capsid-like protein